MANRLVGGSLHIWRFIMNKFFGVLLAILFTASTIGHAGAASKRAQGGPTNPGDIRLQYSSHARSHVPSDIKSLPGDGFACNKQGKNMNSGSNTNKDEGRCMKYHSASENSNWVIRYAGTGGAQQVFKLDKNNLKLWVAFEAENSTAITYASAEAQNSTNKTSEGVNTEVAQSPQPAKENCGGKGFIEKAACEMRNAGIERAVGAIMK